MSFPVPDVVPTPAALAAVAAPGAPVVLPDAQPGWVRVVFRYAPGPGTGVRPAEVWLDLNGVTHRTAHEAGWMLPTDDGDGWHLTVRLPASMRAGYSYVPAARHAPAPLDHHEARAFLATCVPDPHAAESLPGNEWRGPRSVLTLPAAPAARWTSHGEDRVRRTTLATLDDPARTLRRHETPCPPGHARERRPLVFLFDADVWLGPMNVGPSLDRLVDRGLLPPLVVAGLDAPHATRELDLTTAGRMSAALRADVLPALHAAVECTSDPDRTVLAGQSYGGLAALRGVCEGADLATLALCQSPSLWFPGSLDLVDQLPPSATVLLEYGTREGGLTDANRLATARFAARGSRVTSHEVEGGHDHVWWREGLLGGLQTLLG